MNIDSLIKEQQQRIKEYRARILWLRTHRKVLKKLSDLQLQSFGDGFDFNYLPHADTIKVIRALGGKWKKSANDGAVSGEKRINYESDVDGMRVRVWGGQPPPSCKLVEYEEEIPEQVIPARVIPAHKVKRVKMVCTDNPEPLVAAVAQVLPPAVNNNAQERIEQTA